MFFSTFRSFRIAPVVHGFLVLVIVVVAAQAATPNGIGLSDPRQSAAAGIVNNQIDGNDREHVGSFLAHGFVGLTQRLDSSKQWQNGGTASIKSNAEARLVNKWLDERGSAATAGSAQPYISRPRTNHSETVEVGLGFGIYRLGEVDEALQTVSIHGWTIMKWYDDHVVWSPAEYDQLSYVSLPQHLVWKPDMALFNGASRDNIVNIFGETNVIVSSRGNITWVPPTTVRVPFEADFSSWPHDHHRLQLQLGAWSHDASQISVTPINNAINQSLVADRTSYVENDKWKLVSFTARRYVQYYECCPDMPWPSMIFEIEFERRPNFISHIIDWPLKIVFAASCLVFALALESPLRLVYCMLQLLCHVYFIDLILKIIPASAIYGTVMPTPLRHVICAVSLVFFEMLLVVCIQKLAETSCKFPLFLENVLSKVGWLVGVTPLSQFTHLRYVESNSTDNSGALAESPPVASYMALNGSNSTVAAIQGSNGAGPPGPTPLLQDDDVVVDDEMASAHPYGRAQHTTGWNTARTFGSRSIISSSSVVLSVDDRHKNNRQWRTLAKFLNRIALVTSAIVVAIILI